MHCTEYVLLTCSYCHWSYFISPQLEYIPVCNLIMKVNWRGKGKGKANKSWEDEYKEKSADEESFSKKCSVKSFLFPVVFRAEKTWMLEWVHSFLRRHFYLDWNSVSEGLASPCNFLHQLILCSTRFFQEMPSLHFTCAPSFYINWTNAKQSNFFIMYITLALPHLILYESMSLSENKLEILCYPISLPSFLISSKSYSQTGLHQLNFMTRMMMTE